jgi:hypothetical protein
MFKTSARTAAVMLLVAGLGFASSPAWAIPSAVSDVVVEVERGEGLDTGQATPTDPGQIVIDRNEDGDPDAAMAVIRKMGG